MNKLRKLLRILMLLGPGWAIYRVYYALQTKSGYWRVKTPMKNWPDVERDFREGEISPLKWNPDQYKSWLHQYPIVEQQLCERADQITAGYIDWYLRHPKPLPVNWHQNPFTTEIVPRDIHWSNLNEYDFGDVKHLWEPARFCWAFTLLRAFWLTDDEKYPAAFWRHFESWYAQSLPNAGIHWKCGQETSIRVMVMCVLLHGFESSAESTDERRDKIRSLMMTSGARISSNLQYAYSQQNNHGTTEAAALFSIGALFPRLPNANYWREKGARGLQEQLGKLVYADGGFAQHSHNYQRVMLQAVNFALSVAKTTNYDLHESILKQQKLASQSLYNAVSPISGTLPMCGGNDGALLFPLSSADYLDFRPVVQCSQRLARNESGFAGGPWDEESLWFGCTLSTLSLNHEALTITADHYIWRHGQVELYLRVSDHYKHRPAHADQLHIDLFWQGQPVLVDSGSYSYNSVDWNDWFSGTGAHNTVQIDDRDQMPRLSRFLFDHWNGASCISAEKRGGEFEFRDYQGVLHSRRIRIEPDCVVVEDRVDGNYDSADLNWHVHQSMKLGPNDRQLSIGEITMEFSEPSVCVRSWQSNYYAEKIERNCAKVKVPKEGVVTTCIQFPLLRTDNN